LGNFNRQITLHRPDYPADFASYITLGTTPMTDHTLTPEKITKPIQLLAAWLAGLLAIDSCFLFAASRLQQGTWESGALTIAAIVNVPLFLVAVFLLQTKFRPELQEDAYYSTYLSRKTNEPIKLQASPQLSELRHELLALERRVIEPPQDPSHGKPKLDDLVISISRHLPNKAQIQKKLAEYGVLGTTSFGTDEAPKERVVAISQYLPKETFREIVKLARELSFDGYSRFDNKQEFLEDDVLFGAYGGIEFELPK
jgi:hypothetical protein